MRHNYKKALALLTTTMVTFSLVACGSEPKNTTTIPQYETEFKENQTDFTIDWSQFENDKKNTSSKDDYSSYKDSEKQKVNEYISIVEKKDKVIIYVKDLNATAAYNQYIKYWETDEDEDIELVFEKSSKGSTLCEDHDFLFGARITKVTILDDIECIDYKAFAHCISLHSINIPSSVTRIEGSAFWGCLALKEIDIPEGVTYIGQRAFCGSGLTSIKLPSSLTEISSNSFSSCDNLTSVTLPASLKSIADDAFDYCPKLNTVYGKKGTLAEEFANKNGYTFIAQ